MDIEAYIQSGIIESYVLGLASAEEAAEVEKLRMEHGEVNKAIDEFSIAIEKQAFEDAVQPPAEIKESILSTLKSEFKTNVEDRPLSSTPDEETPQTPVVPFYQLRSWRMIAAASIILFVISGALNIYLYNKYDNKNEAYQALLSEKETLQANNGMYQTQLKEWQTAAAMMADTVMATVKMRSTKGSDDAATVFWNTRNKDVYVMVNKLPEPKTGKQYQLWALVDGKPVDAGLLDPGCNSVCKMKNIPKAQAFAITLEKQGGSPTPHLKELYVKGEI